MTTTLLSVSTTPNGSPFSPRPNIIIIPTNNRWHLPSSTLTFIRTPPPSSSKLISLCSPSSSTSIAEESTPPPPPPPSDAELPDQPHSPPPTTTNSTNSSSLRGCKGCGKEEIERGCNGEGRIQGGIATVPGFGWWPIKAYRPCPGFVASGGRYRRQGQSMDEVAFGRVERKTASIIVTDDTDSQSSKKKQSSKKLRK